MANAIVLDIMAFAKKFVTNFCLLTQSITAECTPLCAVQLSPTSVPVPLQVKRLYKSSALPQMTNNGSASFHLKPPKAHRLQPGEWKGIQLGIQFQADQSLFGVPEPLVPVELQNGL